MEDRVCFRFNNARARIYRVIAGSNFYFFSQKSVRIDKVHASYYTLCILLAERCGKYGDVNLTTKKEVHTMSSIAVRTTELRQKIKEGGLSANYQKFKECLTEAQALIQFGKKEYGSSTVSTSESRCYEDAVIAIRDLCHEIEKGDIEEIMTLLETEVIV